VSSRNFNAGLDTEIYLWAEQITDFELMAQYISEITGQTF
jgi:hypothetical protein